MRLTYTTLKIGTKVSIKFVQNSKIFHFDFALPLPCLSNILERIYNNVILQFLEECNAIRFLLNITMKEITYLPSDKTFILRKSIKLTKFDRTHLHHYYLRKTTMFPLTSVLLLLPKPHQTQDSRVKFQGFVHPPSTVTCPLN